MKEDTLTATDNQLIHCMVSTPARHPDSEAAPAQKLFSYTVTKLHCLLWKFMLHSIVTVHKAHLLAW